MKKSGRPQKFPGTPTSRVLATVPQATWEAAQAKARDLFEGDFSLLVERALSVYLGREGEAYRLRDSELNYLRAENRKRAAALKEKSRQMDARVRWSKRLRRERKVLRRENIVLRAKVLGNGFDLQALLQEWSSGIHGNQTEADFRGQVRKHFGLDEGADITPPAESLNLREKVSLFLQEVYPGEMSWEQILSGFPEVSEEAMFPAVKRLVRAKNIAHREAGVQDFYSWIPQP